MRTRTPSTPTNLLPILLGTALIGAIAACSTSRLAAAQDSRKPDVLFIVVDDLNDWVGHLGGYAGKVHTPNIDRLAKRGVAFTNAHCPSPLCCPSRTAVMTGLMPATTGIYHNGQWWRPYLRDVVTIPMHFRAHGYAVAGAGKIFHHTAGNNPPDQWDEYQRLVFRDDPWFRGAKLNYPWSTPSPPPQDFPFSGVQRLSHENDWGVLPGKTEPEYDDARTVDFAIEYLKHRHDKPFFLACGLFRPHLPWYAPREYFDLYPIEQIKLPKVLADDLDDVPVAGRTMSEARRADLEKIQIAGRYKHAVRAYLASISFADAQVGRILDALDSSASRDNTIIVFWSDHGWHHGQKQHWHKSTLWEEATRVPFIIVAPGESTPGGRCNRPVGLIDLYPTLNDLCGIGEPKKTLDGVSLKPLLRDPDAPRDQQVLITYGRGNHAVRSQHWRYIRYADGTQELYDHRNDPHEWNNLANRNEYMQLKTRLAAAMPVEDAPNAPSKSAYFFNPETYTWRTRVPKR